MGWKKFRAEDAARRRRWQWVPRRTEAKNHGGRVNFTDEVLPPRPVRPGGEVDGENQKSYAGSSPNP